MQSWLAALSAGKTFVTNGPVVTVTVNGYDIGETVSLESPGSVRIESQVQSCFPLETVDVIVNGQVAFSQSHSGNPDAPGIVTRRIATSLPVEKSSWIAVRVRGGDRPEVYDGPILAHTSPVYVTVGGAPITSPQDAAYFVEWIDQMLTVVDRRNRFARPEDRERVEDLFRSAQSCFRTLDE